MGQEKTGKDYNHLRDEKSPYLLQHVGNPVDWYPWGETAFQKAKKEDKPVFLSIGYATCHWCHVMAHESFEDEEVARILNRNYVAIKVDREERPDIDKIYMSVCQSLTGRGGWPLSIFMTSEGKPFYAGTYFPKKGRYGITGFVDILKQIAEMWQNNRQKILDASDGIARSIQTGPDSIRSDHTLTVDILKSGYDQLENAFDPKWGGFGRAPKFPTPHQLTFLLRYYKRSSNPKALEMLESTLNNMRRGGIFDQIGFGFHRYSVDEKWLVPHFEKMLYDQAMLAIAYIEAFQATGKTAYEQVAREILEYVLRDMTSPEGGFYSAEDADSEGEEGLFYLWTPKEVKAHLGEKSGELLCRYYDITESGNFEHGQSIPHMPVSLHTFAKKEGLDPETFEITLKQAREKLFRARKKRVHPLKDDKILTSWNGLMIAAFAKGYQAFGDPTYKEAAKKATHFILENLVAPDRRLLRRYRQGDAAYPGYLDDYAFLVWGLLDLYEATFDIYYLDNAISLNSEMIAIFRDKKEGALYFTGKGNESLITRSKEAYDGALPSGNSVAALNFMRLGRMTGDIRLEQMAEQLTGHFSEQIVSHANAFTQLLNALDFMFGPSREIVIVGNSTEEKTGAMIRSVHRKYLPNKVLLFKGEGGEEKKLILIAPFLENMVPIESKPTVYMCKQYACQTPITRIDELEKALK